MKSTHAALSIVLCSLFAVACSRPPATVSEQLAEDIEHGAACENFHEKINTTLTQALLDQTELPSTEDLQKTLEKKLPSNSKKLIEQVLATYHVLTNETKTTFAPKTNEEMIALLMGLEIGDQTTPEKKSLKVKLQKSLASVAKEARQSGLDCAPAPSPATPTPPVLDEDPSVPKENPLDPVEQPTSPADGPPLTSSNPAARGAIRVLTTAYQSCQSLRAPAMDASTLSLHPNSIRITGTHSNGVGQKREIRDLALLQQTHYYVREGIENDSSCFNVPQNPLIYDYGGKPYATNTESSNLNLFKNAGTGTSALGIDCSGYIFSALAVSGLRLSPGKKLKAFQVNGVNARMYMDPANNGLSCLAPVSSVAGSSLLDGDILASTGHIIMIDKVGADPFGLANIQSIANCQTDQISYKNFDFDILHSSPIKNAIGLNRSKASYYLGESSSMRTALTQYAVAACKAGFGQKSTIKPSSARLVRHKMTEECKDTPIALERESCVHSCLAN